MNANEYQKLALRTEKTPAFISEEWAGSPEKAMQMARILHGLLGCMTELGEAADIIKRHLIYGVGLDLMHLMEEAGDKQWYIALILDAAGYTMEAAQARNIAKLRKRYPQGFTEAKALNRDLAAETAALHAALCRWCGQSEANHLAGIGAARDCTFEAIK